MNILSLLNCGAVSQELSFGSVATFICTAMSLQLFENFYCILPLWFYKNKQGNGKMKAFKQHSHKLNTSRRSWKEGSPMW